MIAGAGVDVWLSEPTNPEHPLFTLENVIASSHTAAGTRDTLGRVYQMAFENIKKVELGESPKNIVNDLEKARF